MYPCYVKGQNKPKAIERMEVIGVSSARDLRRRLLCGFFSLFLPLARPTLGFILFAPDRYTHSRFMRVTAVCLFASNLFFFKRHDPDAYVAFIIIIIQRAFNKLYVTHIKCRSAITKEFCDFFIRSATIGKKGI